MIQAFVPRMIEAGEEGFVLNTSSGDGGIAPLAGQCVYAASKAAVSILTECLAAQLAGGTNLRAAIFYPSGGMLDTGIWTTRRNRPAQLARVPRTELYPGSHRQALQQLRGDQAELAHGLHQRGLAPEALGESPDRNVGGDQRIGDQRGEEVRVLVANREHAGSRWGRGESIPGPRSLGGPPF